MVSFSTGDHSNLIWRQKGGKEFIKLQNDVVFLSHTAYVMGLIKRVQIVLLFKLSSFTLYTYHAYLANKFLDIQCRFLDGASRLAQPDGLMNERCTVIWLKSIHSITNWHDIACAYSKVRHFICEKEEQGVQLGKVHAVLHWYLL